MLEEVQKVVDAVNGLRAIEDPQKRARAITELLREQRDNESSLRDERRQLVLQMRETMTFRAIAKELGVSVGTVQDIVSGHSGPWGRRPKKATSGKGDGDVSESPGSEGA